MISIVVCLIYLAICFYGLKMKDIVLSIFLAYLFYNISSFILSPFIDNGPLLMVICVGIGLLVGTYSRKLYNITSFLLCFILTFLICITLIENQIISTILGIILGIIIGYLGVKFLKTVIIYLTSIYGSINFINIIGIVLNLNNNFILLILSIIIAIIGICYQYKINRN